MKKQRPKLTDQVRDAMERSGISRYRLWKETGIPQSTLCRFAGGSGISLEYLDVLADRLGLRIVAADSEHAEHRKGS